MDSGQMRVQADGRLVMLNGQVVLAFPGQCRAARRLGDRVRIRRSQLRCEHEDRNEMQATHGHTCAVFYRRASS